MRSRLKSMGLTFLMVVLSGVCTTLATAASFDLYGTTSSTSFGNPNTLVRVDSSTGVQTLAGIVGLATNTTDIDWNPLTQTLFGSNLIVNGGVIQEIDPATGIATPIATILQNGNPVTLWALAFTSNGMALWGVAGNNAISGLTLGLIDLNTETFSPQLALPPRLAVAGIDIAPNGVLYGIFRSLLPEPFRQTLFTIDLGTLSIIDQQVLDSTFSIDDIDFAPDGFIYHTNFSPSLFRLDPNTGTTTRVGQGSLGALGGLASPGLLTLDVQIDIKPGSDVNPINLKSKGVIPVAILTTEDFDATTVDPGTVRFGVGLATEKHGVGHIEDVDTDGDDDVVYHFPTQDSGLECGDTTATLTGTTFGGQSVMGSDSIVTRGCK